MVLFRSIILRILSTLRALQLFGYSKLYKVKSTRLLWVTPSILTHKINLTEQKEKKIF